MGRAPVWRAAAGGPWERVRRAVRVSALTLALATSGVMGPVGQEALAAGAPAAAVKDTSGTGDAEAAAMTLGAVTIGGLVMRAIVHARRDEDSERERVAAECGRLEKEEGERMRRRERKKMEMVDGAVVKDEELMTELMKRVQSLEDGEEDGEAEDEMRHSPIPDRGMGSAVLERPDGEDGEVGEAGDEEEEQAPKPEELDMLNRMWDLSSGDSDKPNRPTPRA